MNKFIIFLSFLLMPISGIFSIEPEIKTDWQSVTQRMKDGQGTKIDFLPDNKHEREKVLHNQHKNMFTATRIGFGVGLATSAIAYGFRYVFPDSTAATCGALAVSFVSPMIASFLVGKKVKNHKNENQEEAYIPTTTWSDIGATVVAGCVYGGLFGKVSAIVPILGAKFLGYQFYKNRRGF